MDRQNRYDAYPYPERDPEQEKARLLTGSPSDIRELDHYIFKGKRDWTRPFRALIAGGGTGDALIMMVQQLADARVAHEIVYLDRSARSRDIAAARLKARGLKNVEFIVGDLLDAPDTGSFDYIDCCGVLHHLDDPAGGVQALASRLAPDGGMGVMVYAPLGRTGVYPLQRAFSRLFGHLPYERQIASARAVFAQLPHTNWLLRNPFVGDHKASDSGFFDLLLHERDRPFWADEIAALLDGAGLDLTGFIAPIAYDPARYLPATDAMAEAIAGLGTAARARLAEELCGSMKVHIVYAVPNGSGGGAASIVEDATLVPHLNGAQPGQIAALVAAGKPLGVTINGNRFQHVMNKPTADFLSRIDGRRSIAELLESAGLVVSAGTVLADLTFLIETGLARCSSLPPARA